MHTAGIESLRKQVAEMRASVLQDPRRAGALAVFRRVYGVPGTSVMNHVADHGRTFLRADAAICAMVDETGVSWAGSAGCTPPASPIRGELLAEWTVISGTPLLFDDRESSVAEFADAREFGWRAVAAMPIVMDGVAVGTILMGRTGGGNWTDDDYRALQTWMAMNAILNDRRAQLARRSIDSQSTAAARFGAIFERAPMGIVLVDHEGIIEASNSAYADIAGVSRDAVVGRHVREFAQPFADDPSGVYLEEMLAGKRRAYTAERKIVRPDGEERIARVTTAQLREPGAEHPSHLAIVEDVTEYREAESALRDREEQLRQAQKMEAIGQLAGGLAHDFSNALAAISGFASLLREDTAPEDPQRKDIDGILRVAQRASGITRKLLTISKKQVQERATLEIGDVLQEFGVLVRPLLPTTIEYRLVTPSSPVYATIDRTQIEQALLNLSLNARDAMSSGGTLTITLEPPTANTAPPVARIIVEDDGPGIPPGIMTRLWEPFFSTKAHGSGLGLPMSLAIAREHGGDLTAESSSNRGAKFTLQIPVAESSIPAAGPARASGVTLAIQPTAQTILLAEDEEAVRTTSRRLLERAGFTVLSAEDGMQAWRLFLANIDTIDVVVTDLTMPELTGRELVRKVRANVPDMPVVVTSAYSPDDEESQNPSNLAEAVHATLVKPFTGSVLVQTVREVLAKYQRMDRKRPA